MKPDLEQYPLAEKYGWRYPKRDTGGALFLYPPRKGRVRSHKGTKEVYFQVLNMERVESLNPEDVMGLQMRETTNQDGLEPSFRGNGS